MSLRDSAHDIFQNVYYGNIDRGDMDAAVSRLHPDIAWSHAQVWAHHGFAQGHAERLQGREAVRAFLRARVDQLREAQITHHVRHMMMDGSSGAFLGAVEGPGPEKPFMVWFEMKDGLISRYDLRPL